MSEPDLKLTDQERACLVGLRGAMVAAKATAFDAVEQARESERRYNGAVQMVADSRGLSGAVRIAPDLTTLIVG